MAEEAEMDNASDKVDEESKKGDVTIKESEDAKEWKGRKKPKVSEKTAPKEEEAAPSGEVGGKEGEETGSESKKTVKSRKQKRQEAKQLASILSTDLNFKNIGFETALTKEEKAEKRKAKQAARAAAKNAKLVASGQKIPKEKKPKKPKAKESETDVEKAVDEEGATAAAEGGTTAVDGGDKKSPEDTDKKSLQRAERKSQQSAEKKSLKGAEKKSVKKAHKKSVKGADKQSPDKEAAEGVDKESPEVAPDKEGAEGAGTEAPKGEKKKGKKKGKKGEAKVEKEKEEDTQSTSMMDYLRKRASKVMQDFEKDRKQSVLAQGRLSKVGQGADSRRPSMTSRRTRRGSKVSRVSSRVKASMVQLKEEDSSSSGSASTRGTSEVDVVVEKEDTGKRKKGKKGAKKGAKKEGTPKKDSGLSAGGQGPSETISLAKRRKPSGSRVGFQGGSKELRPVEADQDSATSLESGEYSETGTRRKKKRRKSPKGSVEKGLEAGPAEGEPDTAQDEDGKRRDSKVSRASRTTSRRSSRSSAYFRRRKSDYYDDEPVVKKDVPPMVPQQAPDVVAPAEDLHVKKKGKKSKKKKKKKTAKAEAEEVPLEELSPMDKIARMKAAAEAAIAAAFAEKPTEPEPGHQPQAEKPTRKKTKKKMGKGEKSASKAEKLEQERLAAEAEAAAAAEADRIRLNNERRMAAEKAKTDTLEQSIRNEQLESAVENMATFLEQKLAHDALIKRDEEWIEYISCDGLPDPSHCAEMNTYLHLWERDLPTVDMKAAEKKTHEVLKLLKVLDLLIDSPYSEEEHKVVNWKWVRGLVREHQAMSLDSATYRLLRDIANNMTRLDIPTADYRLESDAFSLCVWLKVHLPIPMPNPRLPPPPRIKLKFPEMGMKALFPAKLVCKEMAVRAMYLKYDHLSDTCSTFDKPPLPEHYKPNLQEAVANEWYQLMLYKYSNRNAPKRREVTLEDGTTAVVEPEPEPELLPGEVPPPVPYKRLTPSPDEYVLQMEADVYRNSRETLVKAVPVSLLNMREHVILGGVFYLDLYYQPPQPQCMVTYDLTFTALQRPLSLQEVPFFKEYSPPEQAAAGVRRSPEEIEEELKQQEAAYDKLIFINLSMPQHVIWLDVPAVVFWDNRMKVWTRKYIHDFKHMEEKNYVTFRTGVFGTFGLATNKYASLPYQAWELKPEIDGTVTLQITTALLMLEFNIRGGLVSLAQLQNSPNNALQDIVGRYYKLSTLKMMLTEGGVDIFPEADAFCYVARTCEKHYPMERHLYQQMAQLSGAFNFSWSRWNIPAGRRCIVCQMREYKPDKQRQRPHSMLMVTPLRAVFVDCTEVSPVFSEVSTTDDSKMYADLYHLMKGTYKVAIRVKVNEQSADVVNTLADLLIQTRVNSLS